VLGNRVDWKSDTKGYYEFLRHVVDSGIVAPMEPIVLDRALEIQDKRIAELERRVANPTGHVLMAKLNAAKAKRDAMVADYQLQFVAEPEAAAPKAKTK
jgi:hypothetical protein